MTPDQEFFLAGMLLVSSIVWFNAFRAERTFGVKAFVGFIATGHAIMLGVAVRAAATQLGWL